MKNNNEFNATSNILMFYDEHKRSLPWRNNPNPYYVLVSEIMLQQTRVDTVIPYFERFINALPDISSLASVSDEVLYKLWQGLGYYARVRNLKKAASMIMLEYNGVLPNDYESLMKLPGVGHYTAGAILSIAFNQKFTAVDGNVLRVFTRFYGIKDSIKEELTKKKIESLVYQLYPENRASDFTQALMEIGALICLPNGEPLCDTCPLKDKCYAYIQNEQSLIQLKELKKDKDRVLLTVFILKYNDLIALHKRPDTGLLASLWELPNVEGHLSLEETKTWLNDNSFKFDVVKKGIVYSHVFTHKIWDMISYEIKLKELPSHNDYEFASVMDVKNIYSIPTAFTGFFKK